MSVRIDENTDHMKYTDDMEAIDSDIMDRVIAEMNSYDADIYTAKDVKEALAAETCSVDNFKALLSPAALPFLEEIAQKAQKETRKHFGNSVAIFTPLYIANYCENYCVYCGFNCHNKIKRAQLNAEEIEKEMQVYLEEYSDPTLYLTLKEVKAWNRMPKVQNRNGFWKKESGQVLQAWKTGKRKVSAGGGSKADSMEDLVFLQGRGTKSGTPLHGIWKPEKVRKKGFGEERPTAPHNPQRHSSPGVRQTHSKTGKQVAGGVQSAASSVASSASTVTPATLAARTAKKTAQTFKNYVQEVNQAAQQAIGEEWAKLEDTKQQNAQVGDLPSFVKYVGATIGSVVLAGAAMVLQLAAALFDRACDHAGLFFWWRYWQSLVIV